MKKFAKIIGIIVVIGFIASIFDSDENQSNKSTEKKRTTTKTEKLLPPSQDVLDSIEKELASWGAADDLFDARWANWKVGYNADEKNIYIQVAAQPAANDIAMNGYIDIIKDIHQEYASKYNLVGRVYQLGEQKKNCYVNGK